MNGIIKRTVEEVEGDKKVINFFKLFTFSSISSHSCLFQSLFTLSFTHPISLMLLLLLVFVLTAMQYHETKRQRKAEKAVKCLKMAFLRDSIECKKKSCNKAMALNIHLGNKNPSSFSLLYCNLCVNFIFFFVPWLWTCMNVPVYVGKFHICE